MPTKTWAVGEEVLAADFNTYVQRQVVPTFASAAARNAAMASPAVGQMCAVDKFVMMWRNSRWELAMPLLASFVGLGVTSTGPEQQAVSTVNIGALPCAAGVRVRHELHVNLAASGVIGMQLYVSGTRVKKIDTYCTVSGTQPQAVFVEHVFGAVEGTAYTVHTTLATNGVTATSFADPQNNAMTVELLGLYV